MQPKKNPKADLSKSSGLYFVIGLAFVLFISWRAIEYKTYDRSNYGYEALDVDNDDDEEVPITEQLKTPPPPPPPPAAKAAKTTTTTSMGNRGGKPPEGVGRKSAVFQMVAHANAQEVS